jgi:hypothetical protein
MEGCSQGGSVSPDARARWPDATAGQAESKGPCSGAGMAAAWSGPACRGRWPRRSAVTRPSRSTGDTPSWPRGASRTDSGRSQPSRSGWPGLQERDKWGTVGCPRGCLDPRKLLKGWWPGTELNRRNADLQLNPNKIRRTTMTLGDLLMRHQASRRSSRGSAWRRVFAATWGTSGGLLPPNMRKGPAFDDGGLCDEADTRFAATARSEEGVVRGVRVGT